MSCQSTPVYVPSVRAPYVGYKSRLTGRVDTAKRIQRSRRFPMNERRGTMTCKCGDDETHFRETAISISEAIKRRLPDKTRHRSRARSNAPVPHSTCHDVAVKRRGVRNRLPQWACFWATTSTCRACWPLGERVGTGKWINAASYLRIWITQLGS